MLGLKLDPGLRWSGSRCVVDREYVKGVKRRPRKLDKAPPWVTADSYAGRRSAAGCYRGQRERVEDMSARLIHSP